MNGQAGLGKVAGDSVASRGAFGLGGAVADCFQEPSGGDRLELCLAGAEDGEDVFDLVARFVVILTIQASQAKQRAEVEMTGSDGDSLQQAGCSG